MKNRKLTLAALVAGMTVMMAGAVQAHDADEFVFTGAAVESCIEEGESWHVEWTIANDAGANPFGIIDADTDDGDDVVFAPLLPDVGDGYIPDGDSASATTSHDANTASVTLTVEHDVTGTVNTFWDVTVERPDPCDESTLTVTEDANGAGSRDFDFAVGGESNFHLGNDESLEFTKDAGSYLITQLPDAEWPLVSIDCGTADTSDEGIGDGDIRVHLEAGEDAECVFTNKRAATATATGVPATATAVPATATSVPGTSVANPLPNIIVNPPNVTIVQAAPTAPAPPVVIAPPVGIRPPNTGSGGLLGVSGAMAWGDGCDYGCSVCFTNWMGRRICK